MFRIVARVDDLAINDYYDIPKDMCHSVQSVWEIMIKGERGETSWRNRTELQPGLEFIEYELLSAFVAEPVRKK